MIELVDMIFTLDGYILKILRESVHKLKGNIFGLIINKKLC